MRFRYISALALALCAAQAAYADGGPQNSGNAFNPGIGLVLNGTWGSYPTQAGQRQIPGFMLGPNTGLAPQGFGLGESELDLASNFDNLFTGFGAISFHENHGVDSVEVELAYLSTIAMPDGFQVTAGKFFSDFGYQNSRHAHVWDFVDQPLVYEAMLNNQYSDPGVQATWLAPTDMYLLFGAEVFSGDSFPAGGAAHSGNGASTAFMKMSQDIDDSNTWFAGLSYMSARSADRTSLGGQDPQFSDASALDGPVFSGNSNIAGADFVWKWAPHGNFYEKNFVFQTEYLHRNEKGAVTTTACPLGEVCTGGSNYSGTAEGWYAQGAYQWRPQWRFGIRYDRMTSDNHVVGPYQPAELVADGYAPHRESMMIDFSNSEFSRIRLQFNRDQSGPKPENEIFLQYIVAMGAHPAHTF